MQRHLWHLWSKNDFNCKSSCLWATFLSNRYFERLTPMHTTSGGLIPSKSSGLWWDVQSSTFQFVLETLTPNESASNKVCANKGNSRRIKVEGGRDCHEMKLVALLPRSLGMYGLKKWLKWNLLSSRSFTRFCIRILLRKSPARNRKPRPSTQKLLASFQ